MHQVSLQVRDFLFDVVCNVLVLCFYMFDVHVVLVQNVVESSIALTEWTMACVICGDSIDLHKSSEYVTLPRKVVLALTKLVMTETWTSLIGYSLIIVTSL